MNNASYIDELKQVTKYNITALQQIQKCIDISDTIEKSLLIKVNKINNEITELEQINSENMIIFKNIYTLHFNQN
jgi:hypothetical protein